MLLWKMQSVARIGAFAPRCPPSRTAALLGGSRPCVLKVFARQRVEKHPVGHRVLLPRSASTRLLPPQVEVFGQALQDHLAGLDVLSRGSGRRRRPHRRPRWPHGGSAAAQAAQGLGAQEAAVADRGICELPRRLCRRGGRCERRAWIRRPHHAWHPASPGASQLFQAPGARRGHSRGGPPQSGAAMWRGVSWGKVNIAKGLRIVDNSQQGLVQATTFQGEAKGIEGAPGQRANTSISLQVPRAVCGGLPW